MVKMIRVKKGEEAPPHSYGWYFKYIGKGVSTDDPKWQEKAMAWAKLQAPTVFEVKTKDTWLDVAPLPSGWTCNDDAALLVWSDEPEENEYGVISP